MSWTCITGSAQGLGRAIALTLAERGASLVLHYHTQRSLAEEVAQLCLTAGAAKVECLEGDFSSFHTIQSFLERYLATFSDTQYLVNNVGNYLRKTALETTDQESKELFQNNFHAPCQIIRALSESIKQHQGAIVNIGYAGIAQQVLNRHAVAYNAAKTALWTVTKSLAEELAPHGVRVNMVSPGYLENSRLPSIQKLPMGRPGTLEETARVVAFLLDPAQNYVTGQNIDVAGGVRL